MIFLIFYFDSSIRLASRVLPSGVLIVLATKTAGGSIGKAVAVTPAIQWLQVLAALAFGTPR